MPLRNDFLEVHDDVGKKGEESFPEKNSISRIKTLKEEKKISLGTEPDQNDQLKSDKSGN